MNFANVLVLGGSALAAAVAGGLVGSSVPDAGAGISAALLTGLGALMLGGWLSAQRAPAR